MFGKCPKCEKLVMNANISAIESKVPFGDTAWKSVAFTCPFCQTILGMQIDPIAIKTDIIKELMSKLRGRP